MGYLMESANEAERLLKKSDYESSKQQLLLTGLRAGMTAVDAGGGAGFVTKIISEVVGDGGKAILVDQSSERLDAARTFNRGQKNISFTQSPLENISIESGSADYVFCRFVFEYLNSPELALKELVRITKPGGKIVVGDLDHNMLSHFPLSEKLQAQLTEVFNKLQAQKALDPYVGRKLYSWFYKAGLKEIAVRVIPHHLIYGPLETRDLDNWEAKFDQIERMTVGGQLRLSFDVKAFRHEFMEFFRSPARFSYSPLILVEGVKG